MDFSRTLSTTFLPYALCYPTLISGDTQQHFLAPLNFPWLPRLVPASLQLPLLHNIFQCLHNVLLCWILHLWRLVIFSGVVVFSGISLSFLESHYLFWSLVVFSGTLLSSLELLSFLESHCILWSLIVFPGEPIQSLNHQWSWLLHCYVIEAKLACALVNIGCSLQGCCQG